MALNVNLSKSTETLKVSLQKSGVITIPALDVGFGLDVSGSFEDEHREGLTNSLLQRLVPWGLLFDPDKKLDVFTFSHGAQNVVEVGSVDARNYHNFVQTKIVDKVKGWNGGTDYSFIIERMLSHFGWLSGEAPRTCLFDRFFSKPKKVTTLQKRKSLVIIATDGDNSDKQRTFEVLKKSEANADQVYFLFLGISNQGSHFPFLEKIGENFSNTGFVPISDLKKFISLSDENLNAALLDKELLSWLKD